MRLCVFIMTRMRIRVDAHCIAAWISRNSFLDTDVCSALDCIFYHVTYAHQSVHRVWIHSNTCTWIEIKCISQISTHNSSIICQVWLNGWVFVYELTGCRFEFHCSHLNVRYCTCFEQGVPLHSDNYRMWIDCDTRTWHNKKIQSNGSYRLVITTQLNHLTSLAKRLSVRLQTTWPWVRVKLQSH